MAGIGWIASSICSLPQLYIFHQNYVTADGQFKGKVLCESIFRSSSRLARQVYLTYIGIVVFYIPFACMVYCYTAIFLKISRKARTASTHSARQGKRSSGSAGETQQQRASGKLIVVAANSNTALTSAKMKILKMSVVIISTFIVCGLPYHILEMIYSYGNHGSVAPEVAAILGGMAVANSAVNPFVFLAFNANRTCVASFLPCVKPPPCRNSTRTAAGTERPTTHAPQNLNPATTVMEMSRIESLRKSLSRDVTSQSYRKVEASDD